MKRKKFWYQKNKKKRFLKKNKRLFKIDEIEVDKILVSKKNHMVQISQLNISLGYNDDDVMRPLCINLSQMIRYVK